LIASGLLAGVTGVVYTQAGVLSTLTGIFYAFVLAATCALASWLLRSSWGFVVAPAVYVCIAATTMCLVGGMSGSSVFTVGFALYIVLPAMAMSAVGTAIGISPTERAGDQPGHGTLAT